MNWPALFIGVWSTLLVLLVVWAVCDAAKAAGDAMDGELRRECERRRR